MKLATIIGENDGVDVELGIYLYDGQLTAQSDDGEIHEEISGAASSYSDVDVAMADIRALYGNPVWGLREVAQ